MASSNVSSVTNHFPTANEGFITTLSSTILSGATTVPLTTTSGLTNGTVFVGIVEPGTVGKEQTFTGIVDTAGNQITGVKWTRGTNTGHNAGVTIVDYVSGTGQNMMTKGWSVEHNQNGTHSAITATSATATGTVQGATVIATGDIQHRSTSLETIRTETQFDYIASGGVWSGDAYASTRNASMTALVCYINGRRGTISAVTARSFTASKDTYVDVLNNSGTFSLVYTEVTNNAASPALAANSIRLAIIVTGASNIAAAGSVNQGQEDKVLPIASSTPYAVTDSLGNLICPRDSSRKILGYRQILANFDAGTNATTDVIGLQATVNIPTSFVGRKIEVIAKGNIFMSGTVRRCDMFLREGATQLQAASTYPPSSSNPQEISPSVIFTPTSGAHTYKVSIACSAGANVSLESSSTQPVTLVVKTA